MAVEGGIIPIITSDTSLVGHAKVGLAKVGRSPRVDGGVLPEATNISYGVRLAAFSPSDLHIIQHGPVALSIASTGAIRFGGLESAPSSFPFNGVDHSIVAVGTPASHSIYLDGVKIASSPTPFPTFSASPFYVGRNNERTGPWALNCHIYDVEVKSGADTLLHYAFDDLSREVATDSGPLGLDGAISGCAIVSRHSTRSWAERLTASSSRSMSGLRSVVSGLRTAASAFRSSIGSRASSSHTGAVKGVLGRSTAISRAITSHLNHHSSSATRTSSGHRATTSASAPLTTRSIMTAVRGVASHISHLFAHLSTLFDLPWGREYLKGEWGGEVEVEGRFTEEFHLIGIFKE